MRNYSKAATSFWTGETGKRLRMMGRDYQVVAFYLFTCPNSNMLGLYYLPLPTLCHEVGGLTLEGASKVLRRLSEEGYAHYDETSEHVWVVEMAKHQLGECLSRKDNRHKALVRLLEQYRKIRFYSEFRAKYQEAFELDGDGSAPARASPFEAPSETLRSQEQEQEQEIEQEKKSRRERRTRSRRTPQDNLVTDAFIAELERDTAYHGIDVRRELAKLDRWLALPKNKHKARSKARFVNWLNRVEPPGATLPTQEGRGKYDHLCD